MRPPMAGLGPARRTERPQGAARSAARQQQEGSEGSAWEQSTHRDQIWRGRSWEAARPATPRPSPRAGSHPALFHFAEVEVPQ